MVMLGKIKEIWRYPVKSMRGELLEECAINEKGVVGDRGWAIRDDDAGEVRGGRNLPNLLNCYAKYIKPPVNEPYPPVLVTFPDNDMISSDSSTINSKLSIVAGKKVSIWPILPPEKSDHYRRLPLNEAEIRRQFAREDDEPIPDLAQFPGILMDYVSVPGTYFDAYSIHLLTTSTLRYLEKLNPESNWTSQRFRPNFVIDTGDEPALIENSWIGKTIKINEVEFECIGPTPRCAITAHPQGTDIEKDPKVLRTIVKEADQNLGIYCEIRKKGRVFFGDAVELL